MPTTIGLLNGVLLQLITCTRAVKGSTFGNQNLGAIREESRRVSATILARSRAQSRNQLSPKSDSRYSNKGTKGVQLQPQILPLRVNSAV